MDSSLYNVFWLGTFSVVYILHGDESLTPGGLASILAGAAVNFQLRCLVSFVPAFYARHRALLTFIGGLVVNIHCVTTVLASTPGIRANPRSKLLLDLFQILGTTTSVGLCYPAGSLPGAVFQLVFVNMSRIPLYLEGYPLHRPLSLKFLPLQLVIGFLLPLHLQCRAFRGKGVTPNKLGDDEPGSTGGPRSEYVSVAHDIKPLMSISRGQLKLLGLHVDDLEGTTVREDLAALLRQKCLEKYGEHVYPELVCVDGCILFALQLRSLEPLSDSSSSGSGSRGVLLEELLSPAELLSVFPPELRDRVTKVYRGGVQETGALVVSTPSPAAVACAAQPSSWPWLSSRSWSAPVPETQSPAELTISITRQDGGALDLTQLRADWTPCVLHSSMLSGERRELDVRESACQWRYGTSSDRTAVLVTASIAPSAVSSPGCLSFYLKRSVASAEGAASTRGVEAPTEVVSGPLLLGPVRCPVLPSSLVNLIQVRTAAPTAAALLRDFAHLLDAQEIAAGQKDTAMRANLVRIGSRMHSFLRSRVVSVSDRQAVAWIDAAFLPHMRDDVPLKAPAAIGASMSLWTFMFRDPSLETAYRLHNARTRGLYTIACVLLSFFVPLGLSRKSSVVNFVRLIHLPGAILRFIILYLYAFRRSTFYSQYTTWTTVFGFEGILYSVESLPFELNSALGARLFRLLTRMFGCYFLSLSTLQVVWNTPLILTAFYYRTCALVGSGQMDPSAFDELPSVCLLHSITCIFYGLIEFHSRRKFVARRASRGAGEARKVAEAQAQGVDSVAAPQQRRRKSE